MEKGIYIKLLKVQTELNAPKNQFNSFGKYHYRNCESILEAVKPLLAANEVTILLNDEIVEVSGRFYVKATAQFIDIENGDCIESSAFAREEENKKGMDAAQLSGSTSSYAKKYALGGLLLIDDAKDADYTNDGTDNKNAQNVAKNTQSAQAKPTREQIIAKCLEYTKALDYDETEMRDYLNSATDAEVIERFSMLQKQIKFRV